MKVNVHAHVFNFQSILTKETILLLKHRLTGKNLPASIRNILLRYLRHKRGANAGPISIKDFQKFLQDKDLAGRIIPSDFRNLFNEMVTIEDSPTNRSMFISMLRDAASARFRRRNETVYNAIEWLRIGLMTSIDEVTDDLMTHMEKDDVAVLLPMDIIDKNALKREQKLFEKQLDDTINQALRHPGRMLPFGMVNPAREDSFTLFKEAAEKGAVTGLKLYPALGYPVWEDQVKQALELCNEMSLPVLLHCNDEGFRKSDDDAQHGRPDHWIPVLDALPNLKVCFGHFSGDKENDKPVWTAESIPSGSWADQILGMMGTYKGRVFADVSYHAGQFKSDEAAANYRKNLKQQLGKPDIRTQVLWGTDYHLLRIDATDTDYADGFLEWLGEDDFNQIAKINGQRYLGLPDEDAEASEAIKKHISWLYKNQARSVLGKPAGWLRHHPEGKLIEGNPVSGEAYWSRNNVLHVALFRVVWYTDPPHISRGAKSHIEDKTDNLPGVFEKLGRLTMQQMVFHQDVLGSSSDRSERIRSFLSDIEVQLNQSSSLERFNTDDAELRQKVMKICSDPGQTIPDLAEILALFYRAKTNIEGS